MANTFAGVKSPQRALILTGISPEKFDGDRAEFHTAYFKYVEAFFEPFDGPTPRFTYLDKPFQEQDNVRLDAFMASLQENATTILRTQVCTWDDVLNDRRLAAQRAKENEIEALDMRASMQLREVYKEELAAFQNGDPWTNSLAASGGVLLFIEPVSGCLASAISHMLRIWNGKKLRKLEKRVNSIRISGGPQAEPEDMRKLCEEEDVKLEIAEGLGRTYRMI